MGQRAQRTVTARPPTRTVREFDGVVLDTAQQRLPVGREGNGTTAIRRAQGMRSSTKNTPSHTVYAREAEIQ